MDAALTIRPMRRDELELGIDWAAAEGWNPGLHDAGSFFAADAGGFPSAGCGWVVERRSSAAR